MTTPSPTPAASCWQPCRPDCSVCPPGNCYARDEEVAPAASAQDISGEAVDSLNERLHALVLLRRRAALHQSSDTEAEWLLETQGTLRALRQRLTEAESHNAQLAGEVEELRKDAQRYVFLFDESIGSWWDHPSLGPLIDFFRGQEVPKYKVDAAIDAALARKQGGRK